MTAAHALDVSAAPSVEKRAQPLRFRVADWMACSPALQERQQWLAWAGGAAPRDAAAVEPALPTALRRRVSAIGQMMFRTIYGLGTAPPARFVFCSRHGEYRRTQALLDAVATREAPSPAEFSLSVHNALAGLLSIAWKNDAGHTAVAAGSDSFGFGLLEAAACLKATPDEPVLLAYFDEPLPDEYAAFRDGEDSSLALALLLMPAQGDGGDLLVSCEAKRAGDPPRPPSTEQARDFLRFLLSGEGERMSPGGVVRWRWRRAAA
ncbi:MAG TPA: beta-ketoacyl synthase chain length factor [Stellaceae bacterium]|nr:beta-ketoacyl synthase chain length factor [Stellaceae bacterium]